jgi:hypothetical protein
MPTYGGKNIDAALKNTALTHTGISPLGHALQADTDPASLEVCTITILCPSLKPCSGPEDLLPSTCIWGDVYVSGVMFLTVESATQIRQFYLLTRYTKTVS